MTRRASNTLAKLAKRIMDTQAVSRIIEAIDARSANLTSRAGMLRQAFEFKTINQVKGDYFEFGLWRGETFSIAHRMKHRYNLAEMMMFGFDSFEGLPIIDDYRDNIWCEGAFACGENELREILRDNGFRPDEYQLIPGFYEESLDEALHREFAGRKAAIVYIDCDLYSSTVHVLNFVHRYLINGTVVCFDDFFNYKCAPDQGEQKALSGFLAAHPTIKFIPYFNYSPLGTSFIVRCN